jgi:hypothetical protein
VIILVYDLVVALASFIAGEVFEVCVCVCFFL